MPNIRGNLLRMVYQTDESNLVIPFIHYEITTVWLGQFQHELKAAQLIQYRKLDIADSSVGRSDECGQMLFWDKIWKHE
jgi:hypothetical protein